MMEDFGKIIEDAERALEESGKLLRRYQSREYRRTIRKLYSKRRAMKKMIRKQESRLATSLNDLQKSAPTIEDVGRIESDMEWFLTWRLKLADFPETIWCDGVQDLQLSRNSNRTYYMQARIWIGPERDVRIEYLCDVIGTVTLSQNRRRLKSYQLEIQDKGRSYWLRKAT